MNSPMPTKESQPYETALVKSLESLSANNNLVPKLVAQLTATDAAPGSPAIVDVTIRNDAALPSPIRHPPMDPPPAPSPSLGPTAKSSCPSAEIRPSSRVENNFVTLRSPGQFFDSAPTLPGLFNISAPGVYRVTFSYTSPDGSFFNLTVYRGNIGKQHGHHEGSEVKIKS